VTGSKLAGSGIVRHVQSLRTGFAALYSMGIQLDRSAATEKMRFPWSAPLAALVTPPKEGREGPQLS